MLNVENIVRDRSPLPRGRGAAAHAVVAAKDKG